MQRSDKTVISTSHKFMVTAMAFNSIEDNTLYSSSADGTLQSTDLDTARHHCLLDLNPNGWNGEKTWRMLYSMEVSNNLVLAGDDVGVVHMVDRRTFKDVAALQLHKLRFKITCLHVSPAEAHLLASSGNDHCLKLWDLRGIKEGQPLFEIPHPRVVNSAFFSPITGRKLLSTCQVN